MRVLIVHTEAQYFGGAEKVLGYFLRAVRDSELKVSVAAVPGTRAAEVIPPEIPLIPISNGQKFSIGSLFRQTQELAAARREGQWDILHGWAARGWELTSLAGRRLRIPTAGTLHDHPRAAFIGAARLRLMDWSARWGLRNVICVSEAVRRECLAAGYPARKLAVAHNGLPLAGWIPRGQRENGPIRLGFIGIFSERKGLRGLFATADRIAGLTKEPWELLVAGEAQDETSRKLVADIEQTFSGRWWWPRVRWVGWQKNALEFMRGVDLLICPSTDFDPLPTVLLEAAQAGTAVLASRVGGVPEIVVNGETGWIFEPGNWQEAAERAVAVLAAPETIRSAGLRARERMEQEFSDSKMVAQYTNLYFNVISNV